MNIGYLIIAATAVIALSLLLALMALSRWIGDVLERWNESRLTLEQRAMRRVMRRLFERQPR